MSLPELRHSPHAQVCLMSFSLLATASRSASASGTAGLSPSFQAGASASVTPTTMPNPLLLCAAELILYSTR